MILSLEPRQPRASMSSAAMSAAATNSSISSSVPTHPIYHFVTVKLNDDNFLLWSHQIQSYLHGNKLFKFVDGSFPCPDASSSTHEAWFCANQNLINALSATLSEPMLGSVVGCKTFAAIWDRIQSYFRQKSTANSSHLRSKINELSRGTRSISDYLQEAKTISDQLASIGENVSNTDLVQAVLHGLGDEYDMLVIALESYDNLPHFSNLRSLLLNHEAKHCSLFKSSTPPPLAMLAAPTQTHHTKSSYQSGARSHNQYNNNGFNSAARNSTPGILGGIPSSNQCQLCHGAGHLAPTCPMINHFACPSVLNSLQTAFVGLQIAGQPSYDTAWYPDTGASTHMTGNPAYLQQRHPYTGSNSVMLGNGDQMPITYTGPM